MSRTRVLMEGLRKRMGGAEPLSRPPPLPQVPAPPARVYTPRRETSTFAREAAKHTTALVGIGHVGTRYATDVVLQFQAELAVAHHAVATELPDEWAELNGFVPLRSRVTSHREFLLRPDLGRRLAPQSVAVLRDRATKGPDVQIILADGLSAVACMGGGKALYEALDAACKAKGLTTGTPVCAKFARVWLEDEIGQEVGAKVAVILLGERPGLGTGDGLSAYMVHEPRIGKTDGDRNMMSNIHARGTHGDDAARRLAGVASNMIAQKTSGVSLDLGGIDGHGDGVVGRGYRLPQVRQRLVERGR